MQVAEKEYENSLRRSAVNSVNLTPKQQSSVMEARTALLWAAPFFATIMYERAVLVFTFDIPTLATDGKTILINPDYFLSLSVPERVFAVCHEIAHMVYEHCLVGYRCNKLGYVQVNNGAKQLAPGVPAGCLPFVHMLMNVAQDFHINAMLTEANVGRRHPSWLFNEKYKADMSSVDIYADLWQDQPPQQQQPQSGGGSGNGTGTGGVKLPGNTQGNSCVDEHLAPNSASGGDPEQAEANAEAGRAEWLGTIAKAAQAARLAGKLPAALERMVDSIMRPAVNWQEHIRGSLARSLGGGGYDWRRADRNWINRSPRTYMPARSGRGSGTVVVVGDTSGSITEEEMQMVLGCVVGILEDVRPKEVIMLWCDTRLKYDGRYDDPADLLNRAKPIGGGGTDFRPPFEWCAKEGITPDSLVYVTDMYGAFPTSPPDYPVVWASISSVLEAPFGEVVSVPR